MMEVPKTGVLIAITGGASGVPGLVKWPLHARCTPLTTGISALIPPPTVRPGPRPLQC